MRPPVGHPTTSPHLATRILKQCRTLRHLRCARSVAGLRLQLAAVDEATKNTADGFPLTVNSDDPGCCDALNGRVPIRSGSDSVARTPDGTSVISRAALPPGVGVIPAPQRRAGRPGVAEYLAESSALYLILIRIQCLVLELHQLKTGLRDQPGAAAPTGILDDRRAPARRRTPRLPPDSAWPAQITDCDVSHRGTAGHNPRTGNMRTIGTAGSPTPRNQLS